MFQITFGAIVLAIGIGAGYVVHANRVRRKAGEPTIPKLLNGLMIAVMILFGYVGAIELLNGLFTP